MSKATIPALYGLLGLDGQPASEELLHLMARQFSSPWAPLASRWTDGSCAVELRTTAEQAQCLNGQHRFALCGRLTNRDEINLLLSPGEVAACDEVALSILWDRYGERILDFVDGSFVYLRWLSEAKQLEVLTSKVAAATLYFARANRFFVFSTRAAALFGLPGLPKELDIEGFVRHAAGYTFTVDDVSRTCFKGIRKLGSAMKLLAGPSGIRERQIWTPTVPREALEVKDRQEAAFELQKRMRRAMLTSLPTTGKAALLLSGGLDSSALAALVPADRFVAICSVVPPEVKVQGLPHEMDWQRLICRELGIESCNVWPDDEAGPLVVPDEEFDRCETPLISFTHDLYRTIFRKADLLQLNMVIDGCYGELGPSNHSTDWLLHLFLRGQWLQLAREASSLSGPNRSAWGVIRSSVLGPFRQAGRQLVASSPRNPLASLRPETLADVAHTSSSDQSPIKRILRNAGKNPRIGLPAAWAKALRGQHQSALPHSQPLLDPAVWTYCAGLPVEWCIHKGQTRALLRSSMMDLWPDQIRHRTDKSAFSPTHGLRLKNSVDSATQMFEKLAILDSCKDLFELSAIKKQLAQLEYAGASTGLNWTNYLQLQCSLTALQFLAWFESN